MTIAIPPRRGLKAKAIAAQQPDLKVSEVARLAGLDRGAAKKALAQQTFGRQKQRRRD